MSQTPGTAVHPLIEEWFTWLRGPGRASDQTMRSYGSDMKLLTVFLRAKFSIEDPKEITLSHLVAYFGSMEGRLGVHARNRKLISIRSLYRWLFACRYVQQNLGQLLGRPMRPTHLPRFLPVEDVVRLLDVPASSTPSDLRLRAILELLYSSGMRIGELRNIHLADMDIANGMIRVLGKGGAERMCLLHGRSRRALVLWVDARAKFYSQRSLKVRARDTGWLWVSFATGGQLSQQRIAGFIRSAGERAGLVGKVHAHLLRHSVATHVYDRSHDIRAVQEMLGHRSANTTAVYTHITNLRLQEVHRTAHPLA